MWTYKAGTERPQASCRLPADAWPQVKTGPQPARPTPTAPPPEKQQAGQAQNKQAQPLPPPLKTVGSGWQERDLLLQHQPPGTASAAPGPNIGKNAAPNMQKNAQNEDKPRQNSLKPPQNNALFLTRQLALQRKLRQGFALFYLLGLAGGSLAYTALGGTASEYFSRFLDAVLQRRAAAPVQLFSSGFLTAFFQLTLVMLCGFFVFGGLFLALFCLVKGAVFGGLCAALLARSGLQAALGIALLWLPEVLHALLLILLSSSACTASLWLARLCFGAQPGRSGPLRPLLSHYTAVCLAAALPCALSVLLQMLFASVPGLS